jgi:hypothetical protein
MSSLPKHRSLDAALAVEALLKRVVQEMYHNGNNPYDDYYVYGKRRRRRRRNKTDNHADDDDDDEINETSSDDDDGCMKVQVTSWMYAYSIDAVLKKSMTGWSRCTVKR